MTHSPHIDPERIAALLDGRLSVAEASALRAQLAVADDDTLGAFADAAAIVVEEATTSTPRRDERGIVPIASARSRRRWIVPGVASAAAAAVIVAIALRTDAPPTADAYAPWMYAASLPASAVLPASPAWGTSRGSGDAVALDKRAVRVGVLLTDLELETRMGRSSATTALALATLLDGIPGTTASVTALRELAATKGSPLPAKERQAVGRDILGAFDAKLTSAGAYLEAAGIAARSGDDAFFDRIPPVPLAGLAADPRLDPTSRAAARRAMTALSAHPRNHAEARAAVEELLRLLAR